MLARLLKCLFATLVAASAGAVPLKWTVETSKAQMSTFDQFQGATYELEAKLLNYGQPLNVVGDPELFWQTNGMGGVYWHVPATATNNVLKATWKPGMDVGAKVYNCFIGVTGSVYNAAFVLRLRPSPGAVPNTLPLPTPTIDCSTVEFLNPTNAPFICMPSTNVPPGYVIVKTESGIEWMPGGSGTGGVTPQGVTNIVTGFGYVTATVTNGLATTGEVAVIDAALSSETNRAYIAETNLAALVSAETNRAYTAETNLYVSIVAETNRAYVAETNLAATISLRTTTNDVRKIAKSLLPQRIGAYLWTVGTEGEDWDAATNRLAHVYPSFGACSGVKAGRFHGRNLDWYYNRGATVIVRSPSSEGKYASIGVADGSGPITEDFLESQKWTDAYYTLPFCWVDGINEKGVVIQSNVVPKDPAKSTAWRTKRAGCVLSFCIIRYVLDRCATAAEAAQMIRQKVFMPDEFAFDGHYLVSDETSSYIVEDGEVLLTGPSDMITNFRNAGVTYHADGTLDWSTVESYGQGLERYDWVRTNGLDKTTLEGITATMLGLNYTKSYRAATVPFWYTEYCDASDPNLTVMNAKNNPSVFAATVAAEQAVYADEHNTASANYRGGQTWQTVHTSIFDQSERSLRVYVQENAAKCYYFRLTPEAVALTEDKVREIAASASVTNAGAVARAQAEIAAATNATLAAANAAAAIADENVKSYATGYTDAAVQQALVITNYLKTANLSPDEKTLYITNNTGVGLAFQGGGSGVDTNVVLELIDASVSGTNNLVHYPYLATQLLYKIDMPSELIPTGRILAKSTNGVEWIFNDGGGASVGYISRVRDSTNGWHNVRAELNPAGQIVLAVEQNASGTNDILTVEEERDRAMIAEALNKISITNETMRATLSEEDLQDQITAIGALGRFLSTWDAATGKPSTEPKEATLAYLAGDYYIVGAVSTNVNYIPFGTNYVRGQISTKVATDTVSVNDVYRFTSDGSWAHVLMSGVATTFAKIAGDPRDNVKLARELDNACHAFGFDVTWMMNRYVSSLTIAELRDAVKSGKSPIARLTKDDGTIIQYPYAYSGTDTNSFYFLQRVIDDTDPDTQAIIKIEDYISDTKVTVTNMVAIHGAVRKIAVNGAEYVPDTNGVVTLDGLATTGDVAVVAVALVAETNRAYVAETNLAATIALRTTTNDVCNIVTNRGDTSWHTTKITESGIEYSIVTVEWSDSAAKWKYQEAEGGVPTGWGAFEEPAASDPNALELISMRSAGLKATRSSAKGGSPLGLVFTDDLVAAMNAVVALIPTNYLAKATVANNTLYITNSLGAGIEFKGGVDAEIITNVVASAAVTNAGAVAYGTDKFRDKTDLYYDNETYANFIVNFTTDEGTQVQSLLSYARKEGEVIVWERDDDGSITYLKMDPTSSTPWSFGTNDSGVLGTSAASTNALSFVISAEIGGSVFDFHYSRTSVKTRKTGYIYVVPSSGIPVEDLNKDVQDVLTNVYTRAEIDGTSVTNGGAVAYANATKQDRLPTAVNGKYLHANATTGDLEWDDASGAITHKDVTNIAEHIAQYTVSTNGFVTETVTNGLASEAWVTNQEYVTKAVTNGLASEAWVLANGFTTTNDVCNIVTNRMTGGYSNWTTGQETTYVGTYHFTLIAVEWNTALSGWIFRFSMPGGTSYPEIFTSNTDPDATSITIGSAVGVSPDVTSTRTRIESRNALGLAYYTDVPTNYIAKAETNATTLTLTDAQGKVVTFKGGGSSDTNCLPLSGGTMTGTIMTSKRDALLKADNASSIVIAGGENMNSGASLMLTGINAPITPGEFCLRTHDGTNSLDFAGKPDGTLTWDRKSIVTEDNLTNYLNLAGGTMTGAINMGGSKVTSLATPTADTDAATKSYADTVGSDTLSTATAYADTAAENSLASAKSYANGKFLPLAGGTMTGPIAINSGSSTFSVLTKGASDSAGIVFEGGTTWKTGSFLRLNGCNNSGGSFLLEARSDSSTGKTLCGKPDGTLTWGGKNVTTDDKLASYLPLAGGTMTGTIKAASSTTLSMNSNSSSMYVMGGLSSTEGASVRLAGMSKSSTPGYFWIKATDGTNSSSLQGTPAGALTWGSNDISGNVVDYSSAITKKSGTTGTLNLYGVGKLRILRMDGIKTTSSGQVTLFTLTSAHDPNIFMASVGSSTGGEARVFAVDLGGNVIGYNMTANTSYWCQIIYTVK